MTQDRRQRHDDEDDGSKSVGGMIESPLLAAAIVGGAVAAGAGAAYLGARALARRNSKNGRVNPILATAITAQDVTCAKEPVEGTDQNLPLDGN